MNANLSLLLIEIQTLNTKLDALNDSTDELEKDSRFDRVALWLDDCTTIVDAQTFRVIVFTKHDVLTSSPTTWFHSLFSDGRTIFSGVESTGDHSNPVDTPEFQGQITDNLILVWLLYTALEGFTPVDDVDNRFDCQLANLQILGLAPL